MMDEYRSGWAHRYLREAKAELEAAAGEGMKPPREEGEAGAQQQEDTAKPGES